MSKRLFLSQALQKTGILRTLEMFPSRPGILVINHHRIGDASKTRFDRGVFSNTQDELDSQVQYLKKRMPIICGEELKSLVTRKTKLSRIHAAITFDDGYLDNYKVAFPVLKSHGCGASFFLVTDYVGSATVPWWDEIAYLVRMTTASSITLQTPVPITVKLDENREGAIHRLQRHYKRSDNVDGNRLLAELREQTQCSIPTVGRRFLNWDEAREMKAAGMEIGSHTCSHRLLSQLNPEQQRHELERSKAELEHELGGTISSMAYPVGTPGTFTHVTEEIAHSAGYEMCFAFYGGMNVADSLHPTRLRRLSAPRGLVAFRANTLLLSKLNQAAR